MSLSDENDSGTWAIEVICSDVMFDTKAQNLCQEKIKTKQKQHISHESTDT